MFIAPIFFTEIFKIDKIDILLLALFLHMIVVPMVYNPESYRISTVLYSVLFGLLFLRVISNYFIIVLLLLSFILNYLNI